MTATGYQLPPEADTSRQAVSPHELEGRDLAALRQVLLAPEREQLKNILRRLDDPTTRASEIARILPQAIGMRQLQDAAVTEAMTPVVREALSEVLREHPGLLIAAMRGAMAGMLTRPWRMLVGLSRNLRHVKAKPGIIEQLTLVHRGSGAIVDHRSRRPVDELDPAGMYEQQSIASMMTCLLSFLRDEEQLTRYAALGHLRIEHFTYGIHLGRQTVLVSVTRTEGRYLPQKELLACRDILEGIERDHQSILREWKPEEATCCVLPPLTN